MDDEIQLISDGDGLAVIGEQPAVERVLVSEGLSTRAVGLPRLGSVLGTGATTAQVGGEIAANSGRWVKLTEESAELVKKYGLMESKTPGVRHVMVGQRGSIKSWLQVVKGPRSLLINPALLAGAAGVMAQLAMQQTMNEITDYLVTIDRKVDDVLRAQKDAVLARMIGAGLVIEEAMRTREHGGRVNEVTWSKVQAAPATVAETQAYALRQLDALAEKLERETRIGDLAEAAKDAESKAQEWLAVLARSFQLQDAIAVIELDRVLDAAPDDLDGHRLGLKAARRDRLELISRSTGQLMARMDAAASRADTKVLLHPARSRHVVNSSNHVALAIGDFHGPLGIERGRQSLEARRWADAATEVGSKVLETGADGVGAARRLGSETVDRARSARGQLSRRIAERPLRRREDDKEHDPED
jgi:hypothetical protein